MLRLKGAMQGRKGFLLLEVLVSVVIITVGLVYIIRSFSTSTRAIAASRDYIKAVSLLEEKLWGLEQVRQVEEGQDKDYFDDEHNFTWELNSEPEEEMPVNKTKLVVSWKRREKKQGVAVTTYLWNEED